MERGINFVKCYWATCRLGLDPHVFTFLGGNSVLCFSRNVIIHSAKCSKDTRFLCPLPSASGSGLCRYVRPICCNRINRNLAFSVDILYYCFIRRMSLRLLYYYRYYYYLLL